MLSHAGRDDRIKRRNKLSARLTEHALALRTNQLMHFQIAINPLVSNFSRYFQFFFLDMFADFLDILITANAGVAIPEVVRLIVRGCIRTVAADISVTFHAMKLVILRNRNFMVSVAPWFQFCCSLVDVLNSLCLRVLADFFRLFFTAILAYTIDKAMCFENGFYIFMIS